MRYEDSYLKKALSLELEPFSEDIYDTVYADSSMARAYSLSVDDVFDRIIIFMYAYKDGTIITIRSNRDRFEEISFYVNDRVF